MGTDKEHQVNGNKVLGRKTKWGIIEGDFSASTIITIIIIIILMMVGLMIGRIAVFVLYGTAI